MPTISLKAQLTIVYSGLLFVALALFAASAIALLRYRLTTRLEETLDRRIQGLENFLKRETTPENAGKIPVEIDEYAFTQPEGHLMEVKDASGRILLAADRVPSPACVRQDDFTIYGQTLHVRAAASLQPVEESVRELRLLLLWSAPLLLLLIGATTYWIGQRALSPVDQMTRAARSISLDNLEQRLKVPESQDEIRRLAEAWNEMLSRLEASVTRMQRFTADAAHELRSPLTAIRTTADLALRRPRRPEEYREALEQVVRVSERLSRLTGALLKLAKGDERAQQTRFETVDLRECIEIAAREIQPLVEAAGQCLRLDLPADPALVLADREGITQVVLTLLDNATKYTPRDGGIGVLLAEREGVYDLEVADSGPGIPAASLPYVFERFYRVDESRDRLTGGHGLGLSIAQQIVQAHAGSIEALPEPGGGARFQIHIPRARWTDVENLESV
jgi:two-component system heavy metal sensor histidine kinase CusS